MLSNPPTFSAGLARSFRTKSVPPPPTIRASAQSPPVTVSAPVFASSCVSRFPACLFELETRRGFRVFDLLLTALVFPVVLLPVLFVVAEGFPLPVFGCLSGRGLSGFESGLGAGGGSTGSGSGSGCGCGCGCGSCVTLGSGSGWGSASVANAGMQPAAPISAPAKSPALMRMTSLPIVDFFMINPFKARLLVFVSTGRAANCYQNSTRF